METKYKLPKEFAEEWLQALRSGNYNQTKSELYTEKTDAYCCLGVACAIRYPISKLQNSYYSKKHPTYAGLIVKGGLQLKTNLRKIPKELKGFPEDNPLVDFLTGMNDSGNTFEEIADWIENNIEFY